ncbi:accessory Sec-dependent serine-rich glycoprotein adhesin, partial [Streptococcus sp. zg-JUN1979]|uniref:accessory Sec-dependent serine-rich glycoprotein adhesin n=1 Tax=Streptococcus sp. zg-JUN1979 TaxID=3391450 RepID=UPI0039A512A9
MKGKRVNHYEETSRKSRVKMHKSGKHWVRTVMSQIGLTRLFKGGDSSEMVVISQASESLERQSMSKSLLKSAAALSALAGGTVAGVALAEETPVLEKTQATDTLATTDEVVLPSSDATSLETATTNVEVASTTDTSAVVSESQVSEDQTSLSQSLSLSVSESLSESVSESVSESISESDSLSSSESSSQSLSESSSQSFSESLSESTSDSQSDKKSSSHSDSLSSSEVSGSESLSMSESESDDKARQESLEQAKDALSQALSGSSSYDTSKMTQVERVGYEVLQLEAKQLVSLMDNLLTSSAISQSQVDDVLRRANQLTRYLKDPATIEGGSVFSAFRSSTSGTQTTFTSSDLNATAYYWSSGSSSDLHQLIKSVTAVYDSATGTISWTVVYNASEVLTTTTWTNGNLYTGLYINTANDSRLGNPTNVLIDGSSATAITNSSRSGTQYVSSSTTRGVTSHTITFTTTWSGSTEDLSSLKITLIGSTSRTNQIFEDGSVRRVGRYNDVSSPYIVANEAGTAISGYVVSGIKEDSLPSESDTSSESASNSASVSSSESASTSQSASTSTSVSQSVSSSESASQSLSESTSLSEFISTSLSESLSESVSELISESVSESVSESISESLSESVSESISESVSESVSESISESVSESIS